MEDVSKTKDPVEATEESNEAQENLLTPEIVAGMSEAQLRDYLSERDMKIAGQRSDYLKEKFEISKDQIEAWKKMHGPIESIHIGGKLYIYRGLRRDEWKQLNKGERDTFTAEEDTVMRALLFPKLGNETLGNELLAGISTTLANNITTLSGFVADEPPVRL